jgi:hypothetical protein
MKNTDIFNYYGFGFDYALLKAVGLKGRLNSKGRELLVLFFEGVEELEIPVTSKVSEDLWELFDTIPENDEVMAEDLVKKIEAEIAKIDPALDAELRLKEAFILTEKRFPLKSLTIEPKKLLGDNVFESLSDTSRKDFSFACIQVALNQPTASAFHLMRALEAEVKKLYFEFKKTNRMDKPMWGPMIRELRNKRSPKPSEKSLDSLDGIRVHFRNPTQHPDAFYSIDEAQDLLNQTITAINMIHREILSK